MSTELNDEISSTLTRRDGAARVRDWCGFTLYTARLDHLRDARLALRSIQRFLACSSLGQMTD